MTSASEIRLRPQEVNVLIFACAKCGAELAIDAAKEEQSQRFRADPDQIVPVVPCPCCGAPFDSGARMALDAFCRFLKYAGLAGPTIQFRVVTKGETG
jgi:hypothetical protein